LGYGSGSARVDAARNNGGRRGVLSTGGIPPRRRDGIIIGTQVGRWQRASRGAVLVGSALAVLALLLLAAAPLGWRAGWWHYRTAFRVLMVAAFFLAIAGAIVCAVSLLLSRARPWRRGLVGVAGLLIALAVGGSIWGYYREARAAPPIHDITTDFRDPPRLVAVLPARAAEAASTADYPGNGVAALQRKAYPEIAPLTLAVPASTGFDRALATARAMGLDIVAADAATGHIEASETSRWFGFTDDCAIRVTPEAGRSRVDMRCVSRQGVGDLGVNARRIERFMRRLAAESSTG
jgi:uncharacterized protein (DUF1499 family)